MLLASLLQDRSVVALKGFDRRDFLQGLVTNDMTQCVGGKAIYAALLTPQGKILFDFFIIERQEGFLLDCAAAQANDLRDIVRGTNPKPGQHHVDGQICDPRRAQQWLGLFQSRRPERPVPGPEFITLDLQNFQQ
jgi:glycine cleavage system aminomethyltransferase T